MKKLIFMMLVLLVPMKGLAADAQFMIWDNATGTMTFGYGDIDAAESSNAHVATGWSISDGMTFSPTDIEFSITDVKKAVFREECKNVKETSLCGFFSYLVNMTEIEGIEYLDTSSVWYMDFMFDGCESLTSLDVSNFDTSNVTSMGSMFYGCESLFAYCWKLTSLNLSNFNTSNVTDMYNMFEGCKSLTRLDVSDFDTSNVGDMGGMFSECSALTSLNLRSFNTLNVTDMGSMFYGCSSLTSLDLSNFNTSNVTDMSVMFYGCESLTSLDLSNFNTSNVRKMGSMFEGCSALTSLDLSNFNTSNVRNMGYMFSGCSKLTSLDVSNFDTSNVTYMGSMFLGCSSLTSLDVSNFDTSNVTNMIGMFYGCSNLQTIYCNDTWGTGHSKMFYNCTSIKGEDGTTYSSSNTSSAYAHPNNGGYFTKKHRTFSIVKIGSDTQYWSSFYTTTRNVKADDNITVYTATLNSDGKTVTLNEIADNIIPCGQAVLMRSTVEDPILLTATSEGTGDYSTNSLKGTQTDIAASSVGSNVYTLACESGVLGFYKYSGTLHGGKAYLVGTGSSPARIVIAGQDENETTGIEAISTQAIGAAGQEAPCYDLQGRRVSPTRKGIYVINGKKVVK